MTSPAIALRADPQALARPLLADAGPGTRSVSLTFDDNTLLPLLLGHHDRHIARIEQKLGVRIAARGNRVTVTGGGVETEAAETTLRGLWARLRRGEGVGMSEVEAALRFAVKGAEQAEDPRLPLSDLPAIRTRKGAIAPRSPAQAGYMDMLARHEMVFGIGPAGTGKTYLAVACAVDALEREQIRRILLVRPAVEAGEKLGFLPGDLSQKIDPYLRPLYDALYEMLGFETVAKLIERQVIEVAPLAYMRGRTLNNSFIILDESQNTTMEQMKMFLTRIGFGSTAVITGDVTQVDLPKGTRSGLKHVMEVLRDVPGISFTHFKSKDVVRHPLVQRIVDAYDAYENRLTGAEGQGNKHA